MQANAKYSSSSIYVDPYGAAFGSMWNDGIVPEEAFKKAADAMRDSIVAEEE